MILHKKTEKSSVAPVHPGKVVRRRRIFTLFFAQECTRQTEPRRPISPSRFSGLGFRRKTRGRFTAPHIVLAHRSFALWNALIFSYSPHFHSIFRPFVHAIRKILSYGFKFSPHTGQIDTLFLTISHLTVPELIIPILNSVYTRSGQNSTPNSNATNLHSSQKRCCSFCISSSNASPTFQVQKSIFHQMTKPIQVTVILPLLLAISFSRNDDIHSSISGISNDLIGVIPTIGQ